MTTFARIVDNVALETFVPPAGTTLEECFHPEVAAQFSPVPDGTLPNATLVDGKWTNPPAEEAAGE